MISFLPAWPERLALQHRVSRARAIAAHPLIRGVDQAVPMHRLDRIPVRRALDIPAQTNPSPHTISLSAQNRRVLRHLSRSDCCCCCCCNFLVDFKIHGTGISDPDAVLPQHLQDSASVEFEDSFWLFGAKDLGGYPGEEDAEVALGKMGGGDGVEDVWADLVGVPGPRASGLCKKALGLAEVGGPVVESFGSDGEEGLAAGRSVVTGHGLCAQPCRVRALDWEGPEIKQCDWGCGRDLTDETRGGGRCKEWFIVVWDMRAVSTVVDGLHELDHGAGAEGVPCETDGAWLVDMEDIVEHAEQIAFVLSWLCWGYIGEAHALVHLGERVTNQAHFP